MIHRDPPQFPGELALPLAAFLITLANAVRQFFF